MELEQLIEDLKDTLEEGLYRIKQLNKADVDFYTSVFGSYENNRYIRKLSNASWETDKMIDDLINDIEYEGRRVQKSNFGNGREYFPTLKEWVTDTLDNMDLNGKEEEEVYNEVVSKISYNVNPFKKAIFDPFIEDFKKNKTCYDTGELVDALQLVIFTNLNEDSFEYFVSFIEDIPFRMPEYNDVLEDERTYFDNISERIATGLVYDLQNVADVVIEYVNNKDLDTDQEEDYDM